MRKLVLVSTLFFLILSLDGFSQKIIISGKKANRALVWSDYTGKPDPASSFAAYTYYNLHYSYEDITTTGELVSIGTFEVVLELDSKRSWVKSDKLSEELLEHEQGHFNIGILCMREMLSMLKNTTYTSTDYRVTIQNIFNEILQKYNEMNVQYDDETNHFKDREQQQRWNNVLSERLSTEKMSSKNRD